MGVEGLIYTNENCIGCNRCISVCPVITANRAIEKDGKTVIEVDSDYCVACGACFDACDHKARSFRDDTDKFFEDLKRGEKISLLLAPAFSALCCGHHQCKAPRGGSDQLRACVLTRFSQV